MPTNVTLAMVREAAERIRPIAHRTPVFTSHTFDTESGVSAFFKCENLQKGGAFKIRGAANMIFSLSDADRAKGLIAYSSGNHAQATAIAARHVGAACTIVMPLDAPSSKLEATRGYGAKVVTYDRFRDNREKVAADIIGDSGVTLIPPFDHPMIIAGQGTAALELLEQAENLDALITQLHIVVRRNEPHHTRRPVALGARLKGGACGQGRDGPQQGSACDGHQCLRTSGAAESQKQPGHRSRFFPL